MPLIPELFLIEQFKMIPPLPRVGLFMLSLLTGAASMTPTIELVNHQVVPSGCPANVGSIPLYILFRRLTFA